MLQNRITWLWALGLAVLIVGSFQPSAWAQLYSGSLTGVVADPTGAVVPAAKVTLTDVNKGFTFHALTDPTGRYVLRNLPPSGYSLAVEAAGFHTYTRSGIVLDVGQNAEVNVGLEVGAANQSVEVAAAAPLLSTQDSTTGQELNRTFINDLPLVNRSIYNLATLAPGVVQPPNSTFGLNTGSVNFISNGGRNSTADILLDGISATDYENNSGITTVLYTPPVDAVQEFKLQQNNFGADIGFSGSTVINMVLRSGTNNFHGSLYEFLQNSDLNANNWFNNLNGVKRAPTRQNQFGGTVGGPIRKDKTFFFYDYQGTRSRSTSTVRAGVPSAAERQGNFGELCGYAGGAFDSAGMCSKAAGQIWDPYTGVFNAQQGGAVRSQFIPFNNVATYMSPGNPKLDGTGYQLPARPGNLIDPVAQKMMAYYPLPNIAVGSPSYNRLTNWIGAGGSRNRNDRWDLKIDQRFTDRSLLSARFSRSSGNGEGANCFGNVADPCTQGPNNGDQENLALNFTHTFNPTTVLNVSYGLARAWSHTFGVATDFPDFNPVKTLGMPGYITRSGYIATPAIVVQQGYQQVGGNSSIGSQSYSILQYPLDTHDLAAGLDKIHGRHEFKAGYEGRMHRVGFLQVGNPEGNYTVNFTSTSQLPASGGGDAMASLLMGLSTGGSYGIDVAVTTQNFQHAWYFQDNWRATSKLTLNLGIRYELTLPRTERYNRMSWIDPGVASPLQVPGMPNLHGGLMFASSSQRSPYNLDTHNIGPRAGLAYQFTPRTVLRAGYGIFYEPIKGGASGTGGGGFTGFNYSTPLVTTYQADGATPWSRLSDPFPGVGPQLPPGNSLGLLTGIGLGIGGPIRYWNATPYSQTWSFGLQHELPGSVLVDANYVGTKGTHLYFGGAGSLNYLGAWVESAAPAQITALNTFVSNPFFGIITDPASGLRNATVQQSQLLKPFPQFSGFSGNDPPEADSTYHAFQLRVEKRFSKGLQLLATYTFSKSIDDSSVACGCTTWLGGSTSLQDPNKRFLERSVSQFDIPQVFQFSYVYALPVGRGKLVGGNWPGALNAVLGGWQTNGIWRFDNGQPIALGLSGGQSLPTYGGQRPNLVGPLTRNNGSNWLQQYFANPQNAVVPPPFTVGNAPRLLSTVRVPGTSNAALSLFKEFPLGAVREGSHLEFRVEAFNALNHPQFGGPSTTVNTGTFGKITGQANSPRTVQMGLKLYW
jgi:hypothetical protein